MTKKIKHVLEYALAIAVSGVLRLLPRRTGLAIGRTAGHLVYALDARHRTITIGNVAAAFGEEKTDAEQREIARGAFRHFGSMLFELLRLGPSSWKRLSPLVELEGVERFQEARDRGNGVILVAAHFGNWELHAIVHGFLFGPIHLVARAQDNPFFNAWLEWIRRLSGNEVVYKQRALGQMRRLLKSGETVAFVIDQNVRQEDAVFVDFFGRKAATTPVASWFALKTGAALVPAFCHPLPDGRYRATYEEPIDCEAYRGLPREEAVTALTQKLVSVQEEYIRRNPDRWLWMHRRWKTRPPEEATGARAPANGDPHQKSATVSASTPASSAASASASAHSSASQVR